jgi:glucose 1-dehydrogenase
MKGLKGKNALITGASSGIGQAIAIRLAQEGCNIAINYRKSGEDAEDTEEMALQKACGDIDNCGVKSLLIQGDVSKEEDIVEMVNTVIEKFGSVDILVNNAGIQTECASHEVKTADFDKVIGVNLRGAYLCARETIKHLLSKNRPGIIINISSVHEVIPRPF